MHQSGDGSPPTETRPCEDGSSQHLPGLECAATGNWRSADAIPGAKRIRTDDSDDIWSLPVAAVKRIAGLSLRTDGPRRQQTVHGLAKSIEQTGFREDCPLLVYVGKHEDGANYAYLLNGHIRLDAIDSLKARAPRVVAVRVLNPPKTVAAALLVAAADKSGTSLEVAEKALLCQRLNSAGATDYESALALGVTRQYVKDLRMLAAAPAPIIAMVQEGRIAPTTAVQAIQRHGKNALDIIRAAIEDGRCDGRVTRRLLSDPVERWARRHAGDLYRIASRIQESLSTGAVDPALSSELARLLETIRSGPKRGGKRASSRVATSANQD